MGGFGFSAGLTLLSARATICDVVFFKPKNKSCCFMQNVCYLYQVILKEQ